MRFEESFGTLVPTLSRDLANYYYTTTLTHPSVVRGKSCMIPSSYYWIHECGTEEFGNA